jgi:hypothetical protein
MAPACHWAARLGYADGIFWIDGSTKNRISGHGLVECLAATPMTPPSCNRHKNLQMVPFSFEDPTGKVTGHICPVPGCGRLHDKEGYFDVVEGKITRPGNTKKMRSLKEQILNVIRSKAQM